MSGVPTNQVETVSSAEAPIPRNIVVFTTEGISKEFRQSEIITNVAQYTFDPISGRAIERKHKYVFILTQECDLLRNFESIQKASDDPLNGILAYEAGPAADLKTKIPPGKDIWKRIIQNNDERYHYVQSVPRDADLAGAGLPPLIIDFRRMFTIPPVELYRQCSLIDGAQRRTRLEAPYREHLQNRAATYFQRVSLIEPHQKPFE